MAAGEHETEASVAHLDKARRWLQLVYCQLTTELGSEESPDTPVTVISTFRRARDILPECEEIILEGVDYRRNLRARRDPQVLCTEDLANRRYAKRRLEG